MTEQTTRLRPHLEEPEVLPVLRVGAQAGLAARYLECLAAVRAEDATDRCRRRFDTSLREAAGRSFLPSHLSRMRGEKAFRDRKTRPVRSDLPPGLGLESWVAEQPLVISEETKDLTVSLHGPHGRRDALRGRCRRRSEGNRGRD